MTEATPQEETTFNVAAETAPPKAEESGSESREQQGFRIPGVEAGKEAAQQLIRPWFDATATTLGHVHDLQQRLFARTQDAMKETYSFLHQGVGQCANATQRTHKVVQEKLKRFGSH